jgi:hypothetical protein
MIPFLFIFIFAFTAVALSFLLRKRSPGEADKGVTNAEADRRRRFREVMENPALRARR